MRPVYVSLGERSYVINVGENLLREVGRACGKLNLGTRCAIITDRKVAPRYAAALDASMRLGGFDPILITVPSGEKSKDLRLVKTCYDQLAKRRFERNSFIVALGGGVVGDLAGFVAATYLRGIPFIQVPTTLLAQVDSSVGGKVGVNLKAGKNLVGAFHQPRFVSCDLLLLRTLPIRQFRSGLAEVIKYAIIYDAGLFDQLEKDMPRLLLQENQSLPSSIRPEPDQTPSASPPGARAEAPSPAPEGLLANIVARCCEIKAEIVSKDENETGLRSILNFGHTIGHAIEATFGYTKYLHGEAISIGQMAAARIAGRILGFGPDSVQRIQDLFTAAGLPTRIKLTKSQFAKIRAAMLLDKKVSDGEVKFVLPERIGQVRYGEKVPMALVEEILIAP